MTINIDLFKKATTLEQLNQCFKAFCDVYGIECFALTELSVYKSKKTFKVYSTYPTEWVNHYITERYYEYDPVFTDPAKIPLPFYWDQCSFKDMTMDQKRLFTNAYDFGIKSGTTITLRPYDGIQRYLTLLGFNLTNNFHCMFWLRAAGEAYFNTKNTLEAYYARS